MDCVAIFSVAMFYLIHDDTFCLANNTTTTSLTENLGMSFSSHNEVCESAFHYVTTTGLCTGSCQKSCGHAPLHTPSGLCGCDYQCMAYKDCCVDFRVMCPHEAGQGEALTLGWRNFSTRCVHGLYKVVVSELLPRDHKDGRRTPWSVSHVKLASVDGWVTDVLFASDAHMRMIISEKARGVFDALNNPSDKPASDVVVESEYDPSMSVKTWLFPGGRLPLLYPRIMSRGCDGTVKCAKCQKEVDVSHICHLMQHETKFTKENSQLNTADNEKPPKVFNEKTPKVVNEKPPKVVNEKPSKVVNEKPPEVVNEKPPKVVSKDKCSLMKEPVTEYKWNYVTITNFNSWNDSYQLSTKDGPWRSVICTGVGENLACETVRCNEGFLSTENHQCLLPTNVEVHQVDRNSLLIDDNYRNPESTLLNASSCLCRRIMSFLRNFFVTKNWKFYKRAHHMFFVCSMDVEFQKWYEQLNEEKQTLEKGEVNTNLRHLAIIKTGDEKQIGLKQEEDKEQKDEKREDENQEGLKQESLEEEDKENENLQQEDKQQEAFHLKTFTFSSKVSLPTLDTTQSLISTYPNIDDMTTIARTGTTDFQIYLANEWKDIKYDSTTWDLIVYIKDQIIYLDNDWDRCTNSAQINLLCFAGFLFDPNQSGLPRSRHKFCVSLSPPYKIIAAHDIRITTSKSVSVSSHRGLIHCLCFILVNKLLFF